MANKAINLRRKIMDRMQRDTNDTENNKNINESLSRFERVPVIFYNDEGVGAVVVTDPSETQSGNYRCRLKLHSGNYITGVFYKDAYDETKIKKGTKLVIYEVELVVIQKQRLDSRFTEDYVHLGLAKDTFEVKNVSYL